MAQVATRPISGLTKGQMSLSGHLHSRLAFGRKECHGDGEDDIVVVLDGPCKDERQFDINLAFPKRPRPNVPKCSGGETDKIRKGGSGSIVTNILRYMTFRVSHSNAFNFMEPTHSPSVLFGCLLIVYEAKKNGILSGRDTIVTRAHGHAVKRCSLVKATWIPILW